MLLWWLTLPLGSGIQALLLLLALGPAVWVCGVCEREAGGTDPSFIVLDEILGMYLALLFLQPSWQWAAAAFALFRFLDIAKPWRSALRKDASRAARQSCWMTWWQAPLQDLYWHLFKELS